MRGQAQKMVIQFFQGPVLPMPDKTHKLSGHLSSTFWGH